jgi:hypothetical protein
LSDTASTNVSTPRNAIRFGCPNTAGISIAIDSSDIPILISMSLNYPVVVLSPNEV